MICKICGAQIPDDADVCEFCGAEILENKAAAESVSENDEQLSRENDGFNENDSNEETKEDLGEEIFDDNERRRRAQVEKMLADKKQQLSEIEMRRNRKRQKQKRNKIILIAIICALAVSAVGIGVYYVTQNLKSQNDIVAATPIPSVTSPMPVTPTADPTAEPSPELSMTPSPNDTNTVEGTSGTSVNVSSNTSSNATSGGGSSVSGGSSSSSGSTRRPSGTSSGISSSSGTHSGSSGTGNTSSAIANAPNSGISTSKITAQLGTGVEVIHNTGTGRDLMTFVTGNVKYYANVSAGSTTAQVKNKHYTITAEPTNETYNGNTVYEITGFTKYDGGDYILPNSGTAILTSNDIKGLSKYQLALARNEIYARHGRKFQTAEYSNYFMGKKWYQINPNYNYSDDNSNLNDIERKNVLFILNAERR